MKRTFLLSLLAILIFSCQKKDQFQLEEYVQPYVECDSCPAISIQYPLALGEDKLATSINTALREEIIEKLTFDDSTSPTTVEEAMESFKEGYLELINEFPDAQSKWEAEINGKVSLQTEKFLSLELKTYIFSGGAHGYQATQFLNFDLKSKEEVDPEDLFKNIKEFSQFAEKKFRAAENIPEEQNINSTGFMFPEDKFVLPENIGFTSEGLLLWYNQYEIASYADGPISLLFPIAEVQKYLTE